MFIYGYLKATQGNLHKINKGDLFCNHHVVNALEVWSEKVLLRRGVVCGLVITAPIHRNVNKEQRLSLLL